MNISSTSSITLFNGFTPPKSIFLLGKVTSIFSLASFNSNAFSANSAFRSSKLSLMNVFTSLTNLPNFGLSSGERSLAPFIISVSAPFLPKNLTLRSYNSFSFLISFTNSRYSFFIFSKDIKSS